MIEQAISTKTQVLVNSIIKEFNSLVIVDARRRGLDYDLSLDILKSENESKLTIKICKNHSAYYITIPVPYVENGVVLINNNEVVRAVCPFWVENLELELDYLDVIHRAILVTPSMPAGILPNKFIKAVSLFKQMISGFIKEKPAPFIYQLQRAINEIVNKMPLHETYMNSYVMNNRLMFCDEVFEGLISPAKRLEYQASKIHKYHKYGWTSLGLSDGSLADKNYLLKVDLRTLSPFGKRYHNPQRNLYSTLGMKGDEVPRIRSMSQDKLTKLGISRKGWNWFTAFVDVPDVFEDQILVDISHADKSVSYTQRVQTFGFPLVSKGQKIKTGDRLSVKPGEEFEYFDTECSSACVTNVIKTDSNIGGSIIEAYNIVIEYTRKFCNGFKITNLHGNKGVIRLKDLGYAIDPTTGDRRKIDVIVGAKTVGKRKNYGQVIEALFSSILEKDGFCGEAVIEDNWMQDNESIKQGLVRRGFNQNGTWECCTTDFGKLSAICGNVFWGVIKTPHDQLWQENETSLVNSKGLRRAGLKLSHVEFRALETMFGPKNPILDEVTSYVQGYQPLNEMINVLRSMTGKVPTDKSVLSYKSVKPLDQSRSIIVSGQYITGTVVDEFFQPDGFVLQLPFQFLTVYDSSDKIELQAFYSSANEHLLTDKAPGAGYWLTDKLYIPEGLLRKCWKHGSKMYGLSEIGVLVNNIVLDLHMFEADRSNIENYSRLQSAIATYFSSISKQMGAKRGDIATYGMAVRYPYSAKAVATLNNKLPKNVIEIHSRMAKLLNVQNGDAVLTERFPCLGFMSVRVQKVRITDNPLNEFVIAVSGNSLVSQNLDFDGDVLFVASFHSQAAKELLKREWENPNQSCYKHIKALNERKGAPHTKEFKFDDYNITTFNDLDENTHAFIVEKNTGVKAQTGPVIALTYNIMRIVENSELAKDQKMKVAIEMFLEKAAQSVFEQKHGGKSLYEIVIDGVCTANVEMLVEVGFKRSTTERLCELIRNEATILGVKDLNRYHSYVTENGFSNLISKIVKAKNRLYFASRSNLNPVALLAVLDCPAVDIPSRMFKRIIETTHSKGTPAECTTYDNALAKFSNLKYKDATIELVKLIEEGLTPKTNFELMEMKAWKQVPRTAKCGII